MFEISDLMQYVLDDIAKYEGFRHPVKASLTERLTIKKASPQQLHPNPDDEFSMTNIGPNFNIIGNYVRKFSVPGPNGAPLPIEPLIVEKMTPEGYMLLNGHHRWAAALKLNMTQVPIQIVNLTHTEDHIKMLASTTNKKRVTFDYDEVLCADPDSGVLVEEPGSASRSFAQNYKERLRWGTPVLINELHLQGYDIWVYTHTYNSVDYIRDFFKSYNLHIDGIINGAGRKKRKKDEQQYRDMMAQKYTEIFHADNETLIRIDPIQKTFDSIQIDSDYKTWAHQTMTLIRANSK